MGIPILIIVDAISGLLVTVRGRKDIHETGVKSIDDWAKLLLLNREKVIKQAEEEMLLEIQRQKL